MDCLQLNRWDGVLEQTTAPRPQPGQSDVVVDVEATGVGRTVAHAIQGGLGGRNRGAESLPRIPGHELVGTVSERGDAVDSVETGERVTAYFHLACGYCHACEAGREPLCENHAGWVGIDIDGGFADSVRLPARNVVPLGRNVDPIEATAIPDAIATPYHVANQRANITAGDEVLVLGAGGGVGIHMVQVATLFGGRVTAVDLTDEKLAACDSVGAHHTVNTAEESLAEALDRIGVEYDAVIDFTAADRLLQAAIQHLAPRGALVMLTGRTEGSVSIEPATLIRGERSLLGSRYCSKSELHQACELVERGAIQPVVSEHVGFDGVSPLLERIENNEIIGRGAMTPTSD